METNLTYSKYICLLSLLQQYKQMIDSKQVDSFEIPESIQLKLKQILGL